MSAHYCYLLKSVTGRCYIGYTLNVHTRLRQHNGELVGGAKKTSKGRPWSLVCYISGFPDNHTALRFEYWWHQYSKRAKSVDGHLKSLNKLLAGTDGPMAWPVLTIHRPAGANI